jgi:hypothetical protein
MGETSDLDRVLRKALKNQYHAALAMLRETVERCPDDLWASGEPAFWRVAYHTLFFTHLYVQPKEETFHVWAQHRQDYQCLDYLPPPRQNERPSIGEPYMKAQVLEYAKFCDAMVDSAVDAIDLTSPHAGFDWYKMPKLEHQIMNIRHIEHHASYLGARLRFGGEGGVAWIASMKSL